jgi:RHS repeat-associated protein
LKKITSPDSSFIQYTYDPAHRLTGVADSLGNHITYSLDNMGNRTAESAYDPLNVLSRAQSRVYNNLNLLSQQIGSAGTAAVTTVFGYDNDGNQTTINAPMARNTGNGFDEVNRLNQITDPASGITQFGYDATDNLTSVKDPKNLTTNYVYNGLGDLKQLVSPSTGTSNNTYDSGGNLKTNTDARSLGGTYSYDALNRVTQIAYGDQTLLFGYDVGTYGKGRLTSASDGAHSMSWAYDGLGRVTSKGQTVAGVTRTVGYGYTNGQLTSMTTPSGQAIAYTYTNGLVTGITVNGTAVVSSVVYEPFGPARRWTWGSGATETRLHDTDGNPSLFTGAEATTYGLDNAFRIQAITNSNTPTASWTYGYDPLDRVASGSATASAISWTYDANGNRQTQGGAVGPTYAASSLSFNYNNRGRMMSATGAGTTNYIYNVLGQRIEKAGPGGTTLFAYDEAGHLLGEYTSAGALVQETIWLGDLPVATIRPGTPVTVYYVHADHLGTPKAVTRSADNAVVWRWDQDPFGVAQPNQNPGGLGLFTYNLRYPGQYYDAETGTFYNYFRDYDPQVGRYVESDPIGLEGGLNTYSYVGSSPLTYRDPLGTDALFLHYVGYPVTVRGMSLPIGHSGVVAIDPATGKALYYEFGLYGGKCGNVRGPYDVGTIGFDAKGVATKASIDAVLQRASDAYGKGSPIYYEYSKKPYEEVLQYAERRKAEADSCKRPYRFPFDTCNDFAREAAGR